MKAAFETDGAVPHLETTRRLQFGQHRLRIAFGHGQSLFAKFGATIRVGEEDDLKEC
jgi:hypothetical protein